MAAPLDRPASFLARYWFPLALIGLLLLALPGYVLFALHLKAREGPINRRLEDAYQLSYHLPIPAWAGLILLLVPPAILVLYFLKLKRKPLSVPSTFLWRKSIEDLHVNSLLQWLRQNVLLLLQLLALLALVYGVMAFRFHGRIGEGNHYILMIDNSASMSVTDVAPNRLEWAKQEALKEIDARTDQDVGMVIVFNSSAEIRQSYTTNRGLLRDAVKRIEPTERVTRIEEALSLADSLANPIRSTEDVASQPDDVEAGKERTYVAPKGTPTDVHLFSDGRFPDLSETSLANLNSRLAGNESPLGNLNLHFHLAGTPGPENVDNVALVTLNGMRDDRDATKLQVFARVLNFRSRAVAAKVRLELHVNGVLQKVYEQDLNLPARRVRSGEGQAQTAFADPPTEGSLTFELSDIDNRTNVVIHARLVNNTDQFPLDDEAWLTINVARKTRILIVGQPNDVLDKFFGSQEVLEVAQVDQLPPNDLSGEAYLRPARNGTYDLVIFDRCAPAGEQEMPRSNTFFIGKPPPPWRSDDLEKVHNPHVTGWQNSHAVLRDLKALYTVEIDQAFKMKDLPPRTPLLIEGRKIGSATGGGSSARSPATVEVPLLIALSRQSFTDLVLTFPILTEAGEWNTLWPLQTSFPLFLRNVMYYLGDLSENAIEESVQPGGIKKIRPDGNVPRIEVIGPDGALQPLQQDERNRRPDFSFGGTERVGLYRLRYNGATQGHFAVNLLDAEESNIEPRQVIQFGNEQIVAGQESRQPRELWKWFALIALIVLMVEWYIYNRRIYV
jgi:hypothetical protein